MNRFIQFCILWAMSLLIISCSCNQSKKDEKIDSPKIDTTVRIKIKRYEKALFNLNKKDLQKKNETQGKNNDNRDKQNREEERNMVSSKEKQAAKTAAIEKQKTVVAEVQVKLDNIK